MKKVILYILLTLTLFTALVIALGFLGDERDYPAINQGKSMVFAHRGFVDANVENSEEAFLKSDSLGFDAIELDVNNTKDGKLIIFHDRSTQRLLGIDANITDLNWNDIKVKPLLFHGKQTQNNILTLEMFLNQTSPRKILYLDFKNTSKTIADSLLLILERHPEHQNIIIADHNLLFLNYLTIKKSTVKVALEGFNKGKEWLHYIIPKNFKPDYYASSISKVDKKHMNFLRQNDLIKNKIVYGVDRKNIDKVFRLGIANIILDYDHSMGSLDSLKAKINKLN